jgi:hypothetical protein
MSLSLVPAQTIWNSTRNRKREDLWHSEGCKCHWCGKPTRLCLEPVADQCTIEHVIPRSKGGTDDSGNLVSACRLCNSRRAYEDQMGLPEGSLLGTFPVTHRQKKQFGFPVPVQGKPNYYRHVALTGDEKRAIFAKLDAGKTQTPEPRPRAVRLSAEQVLREQRDQAQKRIVESQKELDRVQAIAATQEKELKSITVVGLIRKRIAEWLLS